VSRPPAPELRWSSGNGCADLVRVLGTVAIAALLVFDFVFHVRKAHVPGRAQAARWSVGRLRRHCDLVRDRRLGLRRPTMGTEYVACYVTEKALSVENLFVFLIVMTRFADQRKVLLFGIVSATPRTTSRAVPHARRLRRREAVHPAERQTRDGPVPLVLDPGAETLVLLVIEDVVLAHGDDAVPGSPS
jgi:hypothetical protein